MAQDQERTFRLLEVTQDAELRLYDAGIQHLCYNNRSNTWVQSVTGPWGDDQEDSFGAYIGDYNIFTGYGLIMQAKISEPPNGIDFQPINPNSSDDRESASAGEGIRQFCDIDNNPHQIMKEWVYYLQMGGRCIKWTRTEDEAAQFGTGPEGGPRRRIAMTLHGVLESKVPIFANKREDFWYAILYDDPDIKMARAKFPWLKNINAGQTCLGETQWERINRLGVVQSSSSSTLSGGLGDSLSHIITQANVWLRLSAFEGCKEEYRDNDGNMEMTTDEDGEERPKSVKEKMAEVFPCGVHAVIIGNSFATAEDQSMDDCLTVRHAYIAKGQSRQPIMRPMLVVQDRFNQTINYIAEANDYNAPSTYIGAEDEEFNSITKQVSGPGRFRQMKALGPNQDIRHLIYREEETGIPAGFMQLIEFLMNQLPQFQLSLPPSLWGQQMSDQKTATGYQIAATQAIGILAQLRTNLVWAESESYYQACLAVSRDQKFADELIVPAPGSKGRTMKVHKGSLTKGNFRCFPDKDSGFPESTASRRQALERLAGIIAPTPMAQQFWSSPKNMAEMVRLEGLDLVIPDAEAWAKQEGEIEYLLSSSPILAAPLPQLLENGAGVETILDAIEAAIQQAQQLQQSQYQQQVQESEVEYAAQVAAAALRGEPAPQKPPPPPPPPSFDPSTIARSAIRPARSDFQRAEANCCRDWLSSQAKHVELTVGRPSLDPADAGALRPNIAGILNVTLHWMEHMAKAAMEEPPPQGPLPASGSPPKPLPAAPVA